MNAAVIVFPGSNCEHDVVEKEHDVAQRLRRALVEWLTRDTAAGLSTSLELSAEMEARMSALGYVAGTPARSSRRPRNGGQPMSRIGSRQYEKR